MTIRPLTLIAVAAASAVLGGCITVFPKAEPATLYKLSATVPAAGPVAPGASPLRVLRSPGEFTRVAASDRILTTTGPATAYVAGSRWAAPASIMFEEAISAGFSAAAPNVRLATRGDNSPADLILRVEVRTFEAQYRAGQGAPPTVVVEARATLNNVRDKAASTDRLFRAERLAGDNRVGPIVEAFDGATGQLVGDIAKWTASQPAPK